MTTGRINQVLSEGDATLKSHHQLETEAEFNLSKLSHAEQQRAKVRYRMLDELKQVHLTGRILQANLVTTHFNCMASDSFKPETLPLRLSITPSVQIQVFTVLRRNYFHQHR